MQTSIETPGAGVDTPPVPAPRDPGCRSCRPTYRDAECPVHGIDARPVSWSTRDAYRESRFTDEMPPEPPMTRREARADERLAERKWR